MKFHPRPALGAALVLSSLATLTHASNTKGIQRIPTPDAQPRPALAVRALVFGVSDYRYLPATQDLPTGGADAALAAEALQRAVSPIDLTVLRDKDATASRVRREINGLLSRTTANEVAMIFAVTHGARVGRKGYLLAQDSQPEGRLEATAVSVEHLQHAVVGSKAQSVFLMLDTVHAELEDAAGVQSGPEHSVSSLLGAIGDGRPNVFALLSESVAADEGPCQGHGAFACAFAAALEGRADVNADGFVSLAELATGLPAQVRANPVVVEARAYGGYDTELAFAAPAPGEIEIERWAPPPKSVEVCLYANGEAVDPDHAYRNGDRFALSLTVPEDGHLYALNIGPDGAENLMFPYQGESTHVSAGSTVTLPPSSSPVPAVLTPPNGVEQVYLLWSARPMVPGSQLMATARSAASSSSPQAWTAVTRTKGIERLAPAAVGTTASAPARCRSYPPTGDAEAWVLNLSVRHD